MESVSRFRCKSDGQDFDLTVDINVDVYPLKVGDKFSLALAKTLNLDGTPDDGVYNQVRVRGTMTRGCRSSCHSGCLSVMS